MSDIFDRLAHGVQVTNGQRLLSSHKDDIAKLRENGCVVHDNIFFIETHICGFKALGRGDYDTISPGTDLNEPNCKAYPRPDGGWAISQYGRRAEQEKPGWTNNSAGFAYTIYPGPKATIDLSTATEKEIADGTAQALSQAPVYQRGGVLVDIQRGSPPPAHVSRSPDAPSIVPMPFSAIREAISEVVDFKKYDAKKKKLVRSPLPAWLTQNIANRGRYPVPTIEAVSTVPLFLPNGSILTRHGYDENTGIYYAPSIHYGDLMSVDDALDLIDDALCDFPFALPPHKAAAYAGILTLLARPAISGCSPLFLVEANRPGCGKGLLADLIAILGIGGPFSRTTASDSEAEWRKLLTSIFMAGEPAILLDNMTGKLKSGVLDAALTSSSWSDRLLGLNKTVRVPMATVFFATGNQLALHTDTCRRTCHIKLETTLEHPEQRSDCRHQPLLPYIQANRGRLTAAALSLLHHFHAARRPDQGLKAWGSFEGWSLIRNAIVWLDMPDPMESLIELQKQNDSDTPLLQILLDGWMEAGGSLTVKEAINAAQIHPTLEAALGEIEGRDQKQAIGIALNKYKGVRLNGRYFAREEGRATTWTVKVEAA